MSAVGGKLAELRQARRDVAHYAALAEQYPDSPRTAMLLDSARDWEDRVLAFLHSSGWTEEKAP